MSDTDGRGEESENRYLIRSLSRDGGTFGNVADRRWHCVQRMIRFRKCGHVPLEGLAKKLDELDRELVIDWLGTRWNNSFDGITCGISIHRYTFEIIDEIYKRRNETRHYLSCWWIDSKCGFFVSFQIDLHKRRKVMREMEFLKYLNGKHEKVGVKSVWFGLITIWRKIVWESFNGMEDFRYWSVLQRCLLSSTFYMIIKIRKDNYFKKNKNIHNYTRLLKNFKALPVRYERMNLIPFILIKSWSQNQLLINKFTYYR